MSLYIGNDKQIIVKVPIGTPDAMAISFMKEKKDWILKQIVKVEKQSELAEAMGPLSAEDIKAIKKKAKVLIPQRVEYYANLSGITYNRIFIRLQKSRWGSCSREGNLNFNCLLVLMPLEILDSVVVHELCHRRHMDHSKAFYAEVLRIFPDYKRCDKWLKQNGGAYFKRIENAEEVGGMKNKMWLIFAIFSAVFAALTSVLAKVGIEGVNSNLATAIRTVVVVGMAWFMVFVTHAQNGLADISRKSWIFLILSGIATGLSWLCYYKALQLGKASKVVPVDKMSVVLTLIFAFVFLHEQFTLKSIIGCVLISAGTIFMVI